MIKSIFTLLVVLFAINFSTGQEFRFKKELEFSPTGNFMFIRKNSFYNLGGITTFRFFVHPKLAFYGEVGSGFAKINAQEDFKATSYTFGVGMNYFFKQNQTGFYANAGVSLGRTKFINGTTMDDNWYGKIGLGYRVNLSERLFLSIEENVKFNYKQRAAFFEPRIGLGIRF